MCLCVPKSRSQTEAIKKPRSGMVGSFQDTWKLFRFDISLMRFLFCYLRLEILAKTGE